MLMNTDQLFSSTKKHSCIEKKKKQSKCLTNDLTKRTLVYNITTEREQAEKSLWLASVGAVPKS